MNMKHLIVNIIIIMIILAGMALHTLWEEDDDPDIFIPEDPVMDYPLEEIREFTTMDMRTGGNHTTSWGIFRRAQGGNCCEHYLAPTHDGWITNLGGEYPTWSTDRGETWHQFIPPTQPIDHLGEGSITETPDHDIIATGWFPYTGDKLYGFHYSRQTDSWTWMDNHLHTPFYDRAWQVVVPGPIFSQGNTFPWASFVTSNFWRQAQIGYTISLDGLNYVQYPDPRTLPVLGTVSFPIDLTPDEMWDYIIPLREIHAMPLLHDGGVLFPHYFGTDDHAYLDTNLVWHHYQMPQGTSLPARQLQIDSTGAMHGLSQSGSGVTYHLSLDGGTTWESHDFRYPWQEGSLEEWDFRAHGAKELVAINLRVEVQEDGRAADKDMVFHIRDYRESIEPDTLTLIGLGDVDATPGAGNDPRFDFASIIILPDGGVVVSFMDSTDNNPLFALELEMPYPDNPYRDLPEPDRDQMQGQRLSTSTKRSVAPPPRAPWYPVPGLSSRGRSRPAGLVTS